jgi:hypothetical protein
VTRVLGLKNKFWNELKIVEQKFVLQVPGRPKDIFLKESKLGLKCEFTGIGNLKIQGLEATSKWQV